MTISIENNSKEILNFDYEKLIGTVAEAVTDYLSCPFETEIYVELVDNNRIREINKQFRNLDRPTDVLSFPMIEYDSPGNFSGFENKDDLFNPETGELILGDIILSVERAKSQAEEYGHGIIREIGFLIAHSMLHLFGYDHMKEDEMKVMERMQDEILNTINITR